MRNTKKTRKYIQYGVIMLALLLSGYGMTEFETAEQTQASSGAVSEDWQKVASAEGALTVTFLDVGQGNAVLVEHDNAYLLIDGGDREYSSYVVSFLQDEGVEKLDYVVASHYDADHLNGVVGALHAFPCDLLLDADYTADTRVYASLLAVVDEKEIVEVHPDMGDKYVFGDAYFTIVGPDAYDYTDANDNSIGIRLVHGENSFLICGDAGSRVETVMAQSGLDISADVYLANHHGSESSSSAAFLEKVAPKAVVISAGRGNSYGHPMPETLERIKASGAELYRTDLQGVIRVVSDGEMLQWSVASTQDYRSGRELP